MSAFSDNPDIQLMIDLAQLGVNDSAKKAMKEFFATLDPIRKARVLDILEGEDQDIARLIVATVPKMRASLLGRGKSLKQLFQSLSLNH